MVSFELFTKSKMKIPPWILSMRGPACSKLRPEVTEEVEDAAKEIVSLSVEEYIKGSVCTIIENLHF